MDDLGDIMNVSRRWKTMDELNDYVVRLSGDEAEDLIEVLNLHITFMDDYYSDSCKELRDDLVRLRDKAGLW